MTVALAQRQWGVYDSPPPDFSKAPVNADAVAWDPGAAKAAGQATTSGQAPSRGGVELFQGLERTNVRASTAPSQVEPAQLTPDPGAAPLSDQANNYGNPLRGGRDQAPEINASNPPADSRMGAAAATSADPFQSSAATLPTETQTPAASGYAGGRATAIGQQNDRQIVPTSGATPATTGGVQNTVGEAPADSTAQIPAATANPLPAAIQPTATGALPQANPYPSAPYSPSENRLGTVPASPSASGDLANSNAMPSVTAMNNSIASASPPYSAPPYSASGMPAADPSANVGAAAMNIEGMGRPGDKKLEGPQSPSVTIEKIAPPEIQVGKPAKLQIVVRNIGQVDASNVEVIDAVPQGTQLVSTNPKATVGPRGEIDWKLGDMKPGAETKLELELMPLSEGEIGGVAVVQFRATASVRTIATKPELVLEINAPKQVMIGSDAAVGIKLSNPGTGAASKVILQERVPAGLQHPAGGELELEIGTLKPGETRELNLTLHAVQAGKFVNTLVAQGDANLRTEQGATIEVIAPGLSVNLAGPTLRYLERQAKYTVGVSNPGTASAKNVELVTHLPKGMQFVEASDSGHYDPASHSVMWSLAELPAGQSGSVNLTTLAKEAGEQKFRTEGRAAGGLTDANEQVTMVEGVAAVLFTVADVEDPVEVGGQVTYEIHVVNQGSKAANRVQVRALLPQEIRPTGAEGPAKFTTDGQSVLFEPLARLAPKADVTYRVTGQCLVQGDQRVKVQLQTDEMAQPVTKEESTRVYKD
jgi:uncharacterized repeat protein (TIGR01451 family)